MTPLSTELVREARGVQRVTDSADLARVQEPSQAAAIWERRLPTGFQAWVDSLPAESLPAVRKVLRPEQVADALVELSDQAGLAQGPERDWLISDVAQLASEFADLMQAPHVRLRLDVIRNNACRKFHVDAIRARLICTYRGTGTQYGTAARGEAPEQVFTLDAGAPIVLRGMLWPEEPASGLLHRSPPIEGSGETRWVLVLDPVYDADAEL